MSCVKCHTCADTATCLHQTQAGIAGISCGGSKQQLLLLGWKTVSVYNTFRSVLRWVGRWLRLTTGGCSGTPTAAAGTTTAPAAATGAAAGPATAAMLIWACTVFEAQVSKHAC